MRKQRVHYLEGPEVQEFEIDDLPERWQTEEDSSPEVPTADGYPDASYPMSPVPLDSAYGYPTPGFQLNYQSPPRRHDEEKHSSHIYNPVNLSTIITVKWNSLLQICFYYNSQMTYQCPLLHIVALDN